MCKTCGEKSIRKSQHKKTLRKKRDKCPEDDEKQKELPKCPNQKRKNPAKAKKCLTKIEKIMLRIQPPIGDRERYFHPEHVNCFLEESERVYIKKPKCAPCPLERPKVCDQDKKKKKKSSDNPVGEKDQDNDKVKHEVNAAKDKDQKTENGIETDTKSEAIAKEGAGNNRVKKDDEKHERSKAKGQAKKNKKNKKKERRRHKENIEEDSDSEISICSNDSEVCLVGLHLTKEDKEKIEENRRKVHPSPDSGDKSTMNVKDAQEVSTQEDKDIQ